MKTNIQGTKKFVYCMVFIFVNLSILFSNQDLGSKIDSYMSSWHKMKRFTGSILVAKKNRIIFQKGYGYANKEKKIRNMGNTSFNIGSISKQFTTLLIFQLAAEGKIKLSDKISMYLKKYRNDIGKLVTIDNLLRHTSGIPCYLRGYKRKFEDNFRLPFPSHIKFKRATLISEHMSENLLFNPGTQYRYSNTGFFLLSLIIEKVTGKSYEDNLKNRIFLPLKMNDSCLLKDNDFKRNVAIGYTKYSGGFVHSKKIHPQNFYGSSSIYSSVEDLFIWNKVLNNNIVLTKKWQDKMNTPYINDKYGTPHAYSNNYYKMRLPGLEKMVEFRSFNGSTSGFISDIFFFNNMGLTIIILDNSEQSNQWKIVPGILKILNKETPLSPKVLVSDILGDTAINENIFKAKKKYLKLEQKSRSKYEFIGLEAQLNQSGYILLDAGKHNKAKKLFQLNALLHPISYNVFSSLADLYTRTGNRTKKKKMLKKSEVLKKQSNSINEYLKKYKLIELKRIIKNIRKIDKKASIFKDYIIGPVFGNYFRKSQNKKALQVCKIWILGNPYKASPYFSMARVYKKMNETEKAINCYRTILKISPNGPWSLNAKKAILKLSKKQTF